MNLLIWFSFFALLLSSTFILIYNSQKDPYMDEIFHVPQAKQYCDGNFSSWDPMITTLPGLYLMTVGILIPMQNMLNIDEICTVLLLRMVNASFAIGNFYLIYAITCKLNEDDKTVRRRAAMTAFTLSLLPVLFFFNFLYYTDVGSTFLVMFMYLLHLHDNKIMASIVGVVAIVFRQTNVVWIVFLAGLTASDVLTEWTKQQMEAGDKSNHQAYQSEFRISEIVNIFIKSMSTNCTSILLLLLNILKNCSPYICVILGFFAFVFWNEGIVVGDKSHHTACLNFPQIFYFILFSSFFSFPYFFVPRQLPVLLGDLVSNYKRTVFFSLLAFVAVHYFTHVHVYLLSDNRHYTFYIWARILNRHHLARYCFVPVYLCSYWLFMQLLQHKSDLWKFVYFVTLFAATVPQKLLEFRYFIIPYLIFRLNIRQRSLMYLGIELLIYILVNIATIYLFIKKPFKWSDSNDLQRFMW